MQYTKTKLAALGLGAALLMGASGGFKLANIDAAAATVKANGGTMTQEP